MRRGQPGQSKLFSLFTLSKQLLVRKEWSIISQSIVCCIDEKGYLGKPKGRRDAIFRQRHQRQLASYLSSSPS